MKTIPKPTSSRKSIQYPYQYESHFKTKINKKNQFNITLFSNTITIFTTCHTGHIIIHRNNLPQSNHINTFQPSFNTNTQLSTSYITNTSHSHTVIITRITTHSASITIYLIAHIHTFYSQVFQSYVKLPHNHIYHNIYYNTVT